MIRARSVTGYAGEMTVRPILAEAAQVCRCRPDVEGQVDPTTGIVHLRRAPAPDRLNRHPVLRFVQKVHAACRRVVPEGHLQRTPSLDPAQIDRVPMCERCLAADHASRVVPDRQRHGYGTFGAMDDAGIGHIGATVRADGPSRPKDDNGSTELPDHRKTRPRADVYIQQWETKIMKHLLRSASIAFLFASSAVWAADVDTIAILTPEQGSDFGWNQQGVDAAKAAGAATGVKVIVAEGLGYGDVRATLRELAGEGADLMIAHASGYNTAAPEIAAETGVAVAIVDTPDGLKPNLVADYTLSAHEGAYLAGRLAGKMTRTGTVGIVVSGEPPSWNSQSAGFAEGVKAEKPDVKVLYAVIGPAAYSDAAGGNRVTTSVIAAGADIIFGQGNGSSFGMIQAVETNKAVDGGKVLFIDVIGDKSSIDKGNLLSSVVWDMTPVYVAMINDLKAGTFGTKSYSISLADGSIKLLKTPQADPKAWDEVMALQKDIIDGKIKVAPVFDAEAVRKLVTVTE